MIEEQVDIETRAGWMTTFICRPERDAPHPGVVLYMDAWGIREELRDMARRYASAGYCVALPNLYYRAGFLEPGPIPYWDGTGKAPAIPHVSAARAALTIDVVMEDTDCLLSYIRKTPWVRAAGIGCVGYCMSGQFAISAAARFPTEISAAASIYGTALVTAASDSPHLACSGVQAELYFACAEKDAWAPLTTIRQLETALEGADGNWEVEVYPGVEHGFAFPERPTYDKAAAERHWERMFALFRRRLG